MDEIDWRMLRHVLSLTPTMTDSPFAAGDLFLLDFNFRHGTRVPKSEHPTSFLQLLFLLGF